jgi:hypothetical protein
LKRRAIVELSLEHLRSQSHELIVAEIHQNFPPKSLHEHPIRHERDAASPSMARPDLDSMKGAMR